MSTPQYPSIELIQGVPRSDADVAPGRRRLKVFLVVLVLAIVVGVAVVYARSPVYRASVSVLTVKPRAVDMPSADADVQHVAIQERLLLGEDLLGRLLDRLQEGGAAQGVTDLETLRALVSVVPVPDTNLLELRAEGAQPELLQRIVNQWAESYETFRLEEIQAATGRTTAEIEEEKRGLEEKIVAARAELKAFREAHDIVSLERGENRSLSALKGINNSLNKARERLVEAQAHKAAVDEAIARGEVVVPSEQKAEIARMRVEIARSSARLAELREKYTDRYISRDPAYKDLPAEIEEQRRALSTALELGRTTVRDEAQQAVETARRSVAALESQLAADQTKVQLFTERFKEFKALEEGLERLERLAAERDERLAQIEVRNQQKFPPIQVVEWARLPTRPIAPDYERDLMIALAAALAIALFVTWLVEYLAGKPGTSEPLPLMGVRVSQRDADAALAPPRDTRHLEHGPGSDHQLAHDHEAGVRPPVEHTDVRELGASQCEALLRRLEGPSASFAALLLSGIAARELAMLDRNAFQRQTGRVRVPGPSGRELTLPGACWSRIEPLLAESDEERAVLLSGLDLRLAAAAQEAGIEDPMSVTAFVLWYTYAAFLVRQGIDRESLVARVGPIPPQVQSSLAALAPAHGNAAGGEVRLVHPALSDR